MPGALSSAMHVDILQPMTRLAAILMLGVATSAGAQELHSADFLVGKWSCAHTVGDFKGTYTTTISSALDGQWLRQTYEFPDKRAEFFLGYDPRLQRWVRWGMLSTGEYWAMTAVHADTTWTWSYALPRRPGNGTYTDKPDAVWTKKSDVEYVIDGPTYPEKGKMVTEHHDCKKA